MGLALEALRATGAKLRKNFQYVFIEIMFLYVSVRKVNFTQMGKYGKHCEQTYRNNFTKQVDWLAYNTFLTGKVFDKPGDLIAIAVTRATSPSTASARGEWESSGRAATRKPCRALR